MIDIFLPKGTSASQKSILKNVLTDELPDFEWTIQWNEYIAKPNDSATVDPVIKRIKETLSALFMLPEFHTV